MSESKIICVNHGLLDATIYCPTCRKNFELRDLISKAKEEESLSRLLKLEAVLDSPTYDDNTENCIAGLLAAVTEFIDDWKKELSK